MKEKIKEWLCSQGYPLELKIASALQLQNFSATLANFYKDPNTGQARQIDVIAVRRDVTGFFHAELVIECKRSSRRPWLLLSADHSDDGFNKLFEYALTSDAARAALAEGSRAETIDTLLQLPWMEWRKSRGVGLVPAFNDKGTDEAFKAVAGVMAAALARRIELSEDWQPMVFIFPIVIVDNDLFECRLSAAGEIDVTEIDEARLYFPMPMGDDSGTCVHITTAKNLNCFAAAARNACEKLERFLEPAARSMFDKYARDTKSRLGTP